MTGIEVSLIFLTVGDTGGVFCDVECLYDLSSEKLIVGDVFGMSNAAEVLASKLELELDAAGIIFSALTDTDEQVVFEPDIGTGEGQEVFVSVSV